MDSNNVVFSKTDIGLVRQANEDSIACSSTLNGDVFVVCDGMGGHIGGAIASKLAVDSIISFFTKEEYSDIKNAMLDAIEFANFQILGYVSENPEYKGMGTTICLLIIQDNKAYIAHAGDSRIYLYLNDKQQLHKITKDHSLVQNLIDTNIISEEEAEKHPQKNVILKALGTKKDLSPEIANEAILPLNKDIFVLCSDGLCGLVSDNIIETVLKEKISIEEKGEKLINIAKENGGHDNISLQLIQINNKKNKERVFVSKNNKQIEETKTDEKEKRKKKNLKISIILFVITVVLCTITMALIFIPKCNADREIDEIKIIINDTINNKEIQVNKKVIETPSGDNIIYTGILNDDSLPHGQGSCTFVNDIKHRLSFDGIWENGFKKEGTLIYKKHDDYLDSAYYIGSICDTIFFDTVKNENIKKSYFKDGKLYKNPKDTTKYIEYIEGNSVKTKNKQQ